MSVVETSAKGASFLILFQVASRGFTFLINQILLRFLSPEVLGLSAQLELYSITVLFFSRESIRVACQRQSTSTQTVVNLAFLAVIIGAPLSYGLAILYAKAGIPNIPYFTESLTIYAISAIIELLSEPAFIAAQQMLLFKVRASAETLATISRCIATCASAILASQKRFSAGVLPFAIGQLAYSVILFLFYTGRVSRLASSTNFALLPKRVPQ
jgi:Rft protein